jgi:hypothetical protein
MASRSWNELSELGQALIERYPDDPEVEEYVDEMNEEVMKGFG